VGEMVGERRGGDTVRETVGETVAKLRWKHQRECVNATTETACSMFQRFLMTLFRHPQPPPPGGGCQTHGVLPVRAKRAVS
jgi:hypothetical protein